MNPLIAYFSATGTTAKAAKALANAVGGTLYEIRPAVPYTSADLNWMDKSSRSTKEMADESCRPAIANKVEEMAQYSVVFVGFPIWWYVAPRIIETFLESYDFSSKTVVPFFTSGGSGAGKTDAVLHKLCSPATNWKPSKRFSGNPSAAELKNWLLSLGI